MFRNVGFCLLDGVEEMTSIIIDIGLNLSFLIGFLGTMGIVVAAFLVGKK